MVAVILYKMTSIKEGSTVNTKQGNTGFPCFQGFYNFPKDMTCTHWKLNPWPN